MRPSPWPSPTWWYTTTHGYITGEPKYGIAWNKRIVVVVGLKALYPKKENSELQKQESVLT